MTLLTIARDVTRRRARERTRMFAAEGVRAVEELLASPMKPRGAIHSPALAATPRGVELIEALVRAGVQLQAVSDSELGSAADTETPQGVIAIADQPERSFENIPSDRSLILVLDAVQDPGNVGTILRTAEAFGIAATIALPGTADLWNAKVVRASMGAAFRHHALAASVEELSELLGSGLVPLLVADTSGEPISAGERPNGRFALAVGNEANGVSRAVAQLASRTIAINAPGAESLNVAVATGILLYTLTQ